MKTLLILTALLVLVICGCDSEKETNVQNADPSASWSQWGRTSARNNVGLAQNLPLDWAVEYQHGQEMASPAKSRHLLWSAPIHSYGYRGMNAAPPAVADGKIFVGSNNKAGFIPELKKEDLGTLVCLDAENGAFLWQHVNRRLDVGKVSDWEYMSICSTPYVEGERLWYVNNRCEVVCLDTEGFHDRKNDGITSESRTGMADADVIWSLDMRAELNVFPHNFTSSSITGAGDLIFVNTGNGVKWNHKTLPSPDAPSFIALNKHTGALAWTDASPGENILHGSWSSPAYGILGGVPQVIFGGGDGWLYSFDPDGDGKGGSRLLWKFDCNPKKSTREPGTPTPEGVATRNILVGFPVIYKGLVYVATGEDPEHPSGTGQLICIDPTKRGDVSAELVYNRRNPDLVVPPGRYVSCNVEDGDFTRENPNSAQRWRYDKLARCSGSPAIADGRLVIADIEGVIHYLNAATGEPYWTYATRSKIHGSPLIASGHLYIGSEDGEVLTFRDSTEPSSAEPIHVGDLNSMVYAPLIAVNDVLYVQTSSHLLAIGAEMETGELKK